MIQPGSELSEFSEDERESLLGQIDIYKTAAEVSEQRLHILTAEYEGFRKGLSMAISIVADKIRRHP